MYAFYDSMRIDMSLQFDLFPVSIRKYNEKQDCADQNLNINEASDDIAESVTVLSIVETLPKVSGNAEDKLQFPDKCHAESFAECFTKEAEYFAELFSLEAALFCKHFANKAFDLHKDFYDTFAVAFIDASKTLSKTDDISCENENVGLSDAESEVVNNNMLKQFPTVKKRKKRTEYNSMYKKKQRQDPTFKTNEQRHQCKSKQSARQDPAFKADGISYQGKSKQRARQNPSFRANECAVKQNERQDPAFKANEINYQGKSKQRARQNPSFRANECAFKQNERQDPAFKANEISYQGKSKQRARQDKQMR